VKRNCVIFVEDVVKTRRIKCVVHVVRTGEKRKNNMFW
jgi:hypothetical protein